MAVEPSGGQLFASQMQLLGAQVVAGSRGYPLVNLPLLGSGSTRVAMARFFNLPTLQQKLFEIELDGRATPLAFDQSLSQGFDPRVAFLKKSQRRAHDIARRAVAPRGDLTINERSGVIVEIE
nr:hypothetical protein ICEMyc226_00302 [Mycolicibacterium sp.]